VTTLGEDQLNDVRNDTLFKFCVEGIPLELQVQEFPSFTKDGMVI